MNKYGRCRILSLDPTSKGFVFALLEGQDRLVEWGHANVFADNEKEWLARVEELVQRVEPRLIVLETTIGTKRRERAKRLIAATRKLAGSMRIATNSVRRIDVLEAFGSPTNKWELAVIISKWFPELTPQLPEKRKLWQGENLNIRVFEAVAVALAIARDFEEQLS